MNPEKIRAPIRERVKRFASHAPLHSDDPRKTMACFTAENDRMVLLNLSEYQSRLNAAKDKQINLLRECLLGVQDELGPLETLTRVLAFDPVAELEKEEQKSKVSRNGFVAPEGTPYVNCVGMGNESEEPNDV